MHGWRLVDESFLFGVAVEAGDGAQPAGDRGAGTPGRFEVAAERFDVRTAGIEQADASRDAVGGVLAEIEGVRLEREAGVAGEEPGERIPLGVADRVGLDEGGQERWFWNRHDGLQSEGWSPRR